MGEAMGSRHVLVVDDDPLTLDVYRQLFELAGVRVSSATDGEKALAIVASDRPDLVVLDLLMPVMDGWQVLASLRRMTEAPPVVAVSVSGESERALGAGARAFFSKRASLTELRTTCLALIERSPGS